MEGLGVGQGWRCLEVGAGGGSMVEWLADRVGPDGSVVATDVYTKFLQAIDRPNVEVREHDVLADEPLEAEFDLVYARLVVEHLGTAALERMAAAVKPGGLLLLEDYDWASFAVHPPSGLFHRVTEAVIALMSGLGFDPHFGRRAAAELLACGLDEVEAEGRVRVINGGSPEVAFLQLSVQSQRGALVDQGRVTDEEVDTAVAQLGEPSNSFLSPVLVSAWGRRPDR